jgi:hypothetical protein
MAKPDLAYLDAMGATVAELINSRPRTPTREELSALMLEHSLARAHALNSERKAAGERPVLFKYLQPVLTRTCEGRAEEVLALINSRPRSPTLQEIMGILHPNLQPRQRGARVLLRHVEKAGSGEKR